MFTQEEAIDIFTRKEPLCGELMLYYSDSGTFPMVRHPLVFSVPHSDALNALMNKQLEVRKEAATQMLVEGYYADYVFLHEKPYRFDAFNEVMDKLSDKEYWKLLGDIWTNSENIWQNLAGWKKLLKSKRGGKKNFMDKSDLKVFNSLPDTVTVYRGYLPNKNKHGLSYSLSKERAEWFAKRWHKTGKVVTPASAERKNICIHGLQK